MHIHTYVHPYKHTCVRMCMHACIHIYMYKSICTCVCLYISLCMCRYICIYRYLYRYVMRVFLFHPNNLKPNFCLHTRLESWKGSWNSQSSSADYGPLTCGFQRAVQFRVFFLPPAWLSSRSRAVGHITVNSESASLRLKPSLHACST